MCRPWSQIKLIALVMLLAVIAHDAVMAGNPHAAFHHSHQIDQGVSHTDGEQPLLLLQETIGGADGVAAATPQRQGGLWSGPHGLPCGPIVAVRPSMAFDLFPEPAAVAIGQIRPADPLHALTPDRDGGPDPIPPPNVRRALLQVFLN